MATSGSKDYSLTAEAVINSALYELRALGLGRTVDSNLQAECLVRLNAMIKHDMTQGVKLWTRRFARLFLVPSQRSYDLPGANVCDLSELSETTLDADEAASQTVISVASTSGFSNSDVIGIMLDDKTIHWSTISSLVTDDTVTIGDALASAASSGNKVYVYTNTIARPLEVDAMQRELSGNEIPMTGLSRHEYETLPNKTSPGVPVNYYFDPQTTTANLYVWPVPDSSEQVLNFTYRDTIEDIDAVANDFDFPQEWQEYLVYNLALRISSLVGKQPSQTTVMMAQSSRDSMMNWDQEEESLIFGVS